MIGDVLDAATESVATQIVDAIYTVHREYGPGLLESVYEEALCFELAARGLKIVRQAIVPIYYKGKRLSGELRLDILVADQIIIEVKSVEQMVPLFEAQLFTYLKLSDKRLGFLVNFNVRLIKDGITRLVR
jgi:GxxExxY protein